MEIVKARPIPQLKPNGLRLTESVQVSHTAVVEAKVTRKDLLEPQYWAHVANKLRPKDKIEVFSEDDSFYATYVVVAAEKTWARLHELSYHNLGQSQLSPEQQAHIRQDYEIKSRGPKKWSVLRKSDRAVLQENMHSEADAEKWLTIHLNSQTTTAVA